MADTVEGCQHQTTWGSDKCIYCGETVGGKGVAPSPVRRGLDLLLARFPAAEVVWVGGLQYRLDQLVSGPHADTPWLSCNLQLLGLAEPVRRFAIWKATGNVYELDEHGAVGDDPIIEVTPL